MDKKSKISAFLVDDEPLALKRLDSLLRETGRVEVTGSETDPAKALVKLRSASPDVLFLDIKMPGLSGFELLEELGTHPPVIFTTAYDQHSLDAFEYFSVDYLLKPIERERLNGALDKIDRISSAGQLQLGDLIRKLKDQDETPAPLLRISSRVGPKVQIVDVKDVTHFISEDKVTFAVMRSGRRRPVDQTLNTLENSLDPDGFMRVHRSTIVNLDFVEMVHGWFSGGVVVRLRDSAKTDVSVARTRVRELKSRLGMK